MAILLDKMKTIEQIMCLQFERVEDLACRSVDCAIKDVSEEPKERVTGGKVPISKSLTTDG